jgi:hypothetical protein
MPEQPSWIDRLPEITRLLQAPDAPPFLDRPAIERLFGLRRRQAIAWMRRFGGYQVGKTFLVDRQVLLAFLEDPLRRHAADLEARRFRSVGELLACAREERHFRRISIPATRPLFPVDFAGLPAGIDIGQRELTIHFEHPQDLLEKLFALSQALANDYETFQTAWRSANPS